METSIKANRRPQTTKNQSSGFKSFGKLTEKKDGITRLRRDSKKPIENLLNDDTLNVFKDEDDLD